MTQINRLLNIKKINKRTQTERAQIESKTRTNREQNAHKQRAKQNTHKQRAKQTMTTRLNPKNNKNIEHRKTDKKEEMTQIIIIIVLF